MNYLTTLLDFLSIGKQLDELYEFLKKVKSDISEYSRELSNKEIKQVLKDFKKGVAETHIICIKIIEADEVEKQMLGKSLNISKKEREEIGQKIGLIAQELERIVKIPAVDHFIGERPVLSKQMYRTMKMRAMVKRVWFEEAESLKAIPDEELYDRKIRIKNDPTYDIEHALQILFIKHMKQLDRSAVELIKVLDTTIDSL